MEKINDLMIKYSLFVYRDDFILKKIKENSLKIDDLIETFETIYNVNLNEKGKKCLEKKLNIIKYMLDYEFIYFIVDNLEKNFSEIENIIFLYLKNE